ncbi:MFS transporter [Paenibacillus sediminis]|uniref:MFS family permease n=1 Tax=Paenibacillus sediminis TaxID=664909 RepID=A0ABS4H090_9BACL|nr:MFS transporter [Paenibacillus sediminis]MBP1935939.1 MFS family permease [Paenibacillus sediminis]
MITGDVAASRSNFKAQYFILIAVVVVAGLSQGLLLPVLSIFMEQMGVSSAVNGMNAAVLYVGSFAMILVAERLLGYTGFKKLLIGGLLLVTSTLLLFPLIPNIKLWFILRLLVGIGDSALHYAAQLWILFFTPAHQRGRGISLYGMSYGLGFSLGPLGMKLLQYGNIVPFAALALCFVVMIVLVIFKLPNAKPEKSERREETTRRFSRTYMIAWYALIPAFLYGYMEAGINSNFPVYGLRTGLLESQISTLLPFVGIGGLILQLPLGMLSDRFGRKRILMTAGMIGGLAFLLVPFAGTHFYVVMILLMIAGGMVGSFFSLGLAYAADLLPRVLLPAANVVASFHFNAGSIIGPNIGGLGMQYISVPSFFIIMGGCYILFSTIGIWYRQHNNHE